MSFSSTVVSPHSHDSNTLSFLFPGSATSDSYKLQPGSNCFVSGLVACVDMDKEWVYHQQSGMLYFQASEGANPADLPVQVRTRRWGFDIMDCNGIEIVTLDFFAAAVNFTNSENCLLDSARLFFSVPFYAADAWDSTESPQNAQYCSTN